MSRQRNPDMTTVQFQFHTYFASHLRYKCDFPVSNIFFTLFNFLDYKIILVKLKSIPVFLF